MAQARRPAVLAILTVFFWLWALPHPTHAQARLYVAPTGNDDWSGTHSEPNSAKTDSPFATLERARDGICDLKQANRFPAGGVAVEIRGGTYFLKQTLELEKEDSGTERGPVVYRACSGWPQLPVYAVLEAQRHIEEDGRVGSLEWDEAFSGNPMHIGYSPNGKALEPESQAWFRHDEHALYVGIENVGVSITPPFMSSCSSRTSPASLCFPRTIFRAELCLQNK
ncbi:MAG: hypothetical protein JXR37_36290 [Kiritimatiellae bacterium]|nr:hypothetical protein [Kiritimatiellia bacterium]